MAEGAEQEVAPEQIPDKRQGDELLACWYGEMCLLWLCNALQSLHEQKSELDKKMQTMCRKRKAIDTKPLEEPMKQWDKLTVQEKHDVAAAMIDVVLISDETGIEVKFSI